VLKVIVNFEIIAQLPIGSAVAVTVPVRLAVSRTTAAAATVRARRPMAPMLSFMGFLPG
jgi:hypothetical protein